MVRKGFKNLISSVLIAAMIIQSGNVAVASEPLDESQPLSRENEGLVLMGETGEPMAEEGSEGDGDSAELSDESGTTDGEKDDSSEAGVSGEDDIENEPEEGMDFSAEGIRDESEEETIEDTDADMESAEDTLENGAGEKDLLEEKSLPEGIKGMPEGYVLSRSQLEMKGSAREHDCLENLKDLVEGEDYVKDQVITLVDSDEDAQLIAEAYSGVVLDYSYGLATISLADSGLSVYDAFAYCLDEDLELPFIEPNYLTYDTEPVEDVDMLLRSSKLMTAGAEVPADNGFSDRWWVDGIQDTFLNPESDGYQWHHDMINTFSAWGVTTGTSDITVAVIDSGITPGHYDFINDPWADNQPTVTQKYVYKELHPSTTESENDIIGHGTHVAGILAGRINGNLGAGVAPGVNILAMKASYGSRGNVEDASIIRAINYAASDKDESEGSGTRADIINLSLGSLTYSQSYETAVRNAYENGVTIVAAMGNDGNNTMNYPAAYDHVIGVCSVDASGNRSSFSNYGEWADISAPGSKIFSADYDEYDAYVTDSGTSMATPIVSGACALYMSAVGHVDPDTMERVLKRAVTGSAGDGTGAGIIDLAKLFNGDTTAPRITVKANDDFVDDDVDNRTVVGEVQEGSTYTLSYDVASDSQISFTPLNFGGAAQANNNTKIVFTTNGKAPSVYNGNVLNGEVAQGEITVNDLTGELTGRKKVTLKAAAVTGMGVMGKVSTLVFYVDPSLETKAEALEDTITVTINNVPQKMVAGKSVTLNATVESDDKTKAVSQKVIWRIEGYSGGDLSGAKIDSSKGILTTVSGKQGIINISCTTADGRATTYASIEVTGIYPVKSIGVQASRTTLTLDYGEDYAGDEDKPYLSVVNVSSMFDTAGHDLLTNQNYSYADKSLQWISSNEAVARVIAISGDGELPYAKVKAVGVGNATITCKVLDGSGKYARVTLKVVPDANRKVQSIKLYEGSLVTEASVPITSATLYAKENSMQISAVQTSADGGVNYIAPAWSSSNSKVVYCETDAANPNLVTLVPLAKGVANITCTARDGSGKKAVLKVTVAQHVTSIKVKGQKYVAAGRSATFTASVLPGTANNRGVTWDFADPADPEDPEKSKTYEGITINPNNGLVTVANGITPDGLIYARARAKDGAVDEDGDTIYGCLAFEVHDRAAKVTAVVDPNYSRVIATTAKGTYQNTTKIIAQPCDKTGAFNGTYVSFKSGNTSVATVETDETDPNVAIVKAVGKGTAVITATAQDGSKKSASVVIKVLQLAETVTVNGQFNVALGTKATYRATVLPSRTNNKAVKWYLADPETGNLYADGEGPEGVTINQTTGVVKVAERDALVGTRVGLVALATDNGSEPAVNPAKSEVYRFEISKARTGSVGIYAGEDIPEDMKEVYNLPGYDGTKKLTAFRLYDTDIIKNNDYTENRIELTSKVFCTLGGVPVDISDQIFARWTSSNEKVAIVWVDPDGKVFVEGLKPGSAKITCTALDGSGKKASVKVTVIKPVSEIRIEVANNLTYRGRYTGVAKGPYADIARGYTTKARVSVGSAYGTPTVSKVKWDYDYEVYAGGRFRTLEDALIEAYEDASYSTREAEAKAKKVVTYCKNNGLFYYFSKGKVTPNSAAAMNNSIKRFEKYADYSLGERSMYDYIAVVVKASATDGTGYSDTKRYLVREAVKSYKLGYPENRVDLRPRKTQVVEIRTNVDDYEGMRDLSSGEKPEYVVASSNPDIAFGIVPYNNDPKKVQVVGMNKGNATLTITAQDGSNKKTTIQVYVGY